MKIQTITPCIDRADLLAPIISNSRHFDRWVILTVSDDQATINLCNQNGLECRILRNAARYRDPDPRALQRAVRKIASRFDPEAWVILLATGVLLPRHFRERVAAQTLQNDCIYNLQARIRCTSRKMLASSVECEPWEDLPGLDTHGDGYFRMYRPALLPHGDHSPPVDALVTATIPQSIKRTFQIAALQLEKLPAHGISETETIDGSTTHPANATQEFPAELCHITDTAAIAGYFPGSRWLDLARRFRRVLLFDRFNVHAPSGNLPKELDRAELRRLLSLEAAEINQIEFCGPHSARTVSEVDAESVDLLYLPGAMPPERLAAALPHWMPKLKKGAIVCGDLFGFPDWPGSTRAISVLLGTPDGILRSGFWWKSCERAKQRISRQPSIGDDIILLLHAAPHDALATSLSLWSLRCHWKGRIRLLKWGEKVESLHIICALLNVEVQVMATAPPHRTTRVEDVLRSYVTISFRKAIVLSPGFLALRPLDGAFSTAATMTPDGCPCLIERSSEGLSSSALSSVSAQNFTDAHDIEHFLACTGRSDYWTDAAWEKWSGFEAELTLHCTPEVRLPRGVAVATIVTPENVGDFQHNWLTWRFPARTEFILVLIDIRRDEFWLPGESEPSVVIETTSDGGNNFPKIAAAVMGACSAEKIAFLPPTAAASPGAELCLGEDWSSPDAIFHNASVSEFTQSFQGKAPTGDLLVVIKKTSLYPISTLDPLNGCDTGFSAFLLKAVEATKASTAFFNAMQWGWHVPTPGRMDITASPVKPWGEQRKPRLAIAVNVYNEPHAQLVECFSRIARNIPSATVTIFLNGIERQDVEELARQFGFLLVADENLGSNDTWHRWWLRMLNFFYSSQADVCFKFDPDTMVDARPAAIPAHHYFGEISGNFIQGGITGLSRLAVRLLLELRLLELEPGKSRPWLQPQYNEFFMDDQLIARPLAHIGIFPTSWSECRSKWRDPILNDPVTHAIVHPRYFKGEAIARVESKLTSANGSSQSFRIAESSTAEARPEGKDVSCEFDLSKKSAGKLRKIVAYACDKDYFAYTRASFASFCDHHNMDEWEVVFADVGMEQHQRLELASVGKIVDYRRSIEVQQFGIVYPSGRARVQMLSDLVCDDSVLVYIDSDTLIFSTLDEILSSFLASDRSIAIAFEDTPDFGTPVMSFAWRDRTIPPVLVNQHRWHDSPMPNTGVLFARGPVARHIGDVGVKLYDAYSSRLQLAEQSVIASILYDEDIPVFRLPLKYNCFVWERAITHDTFPAYVDSVPKHRGEPVVIRHFCGFDAKEPLNEALPLRACKRDLPVRTPSLENESALPQSQQ